MSEAYKDVEGRTSDQAPRRVESTSGKKERFEELYDGFEGEELSEIWSHAKFEEGAVKIQSEIVRKGKSAAQITLHRGERVEQGDPNGKPTERDELLERKELGPREGESVSYAFSMYIPDNFPIVPTRLILAQWKQHDKNDDAILKNPILALRYVSGELYISLQTTEEKIRLFRTSEEIRGRWLDFIFQVRFTREECGSIKVWMNEKQIADYMGVTAYREQYGYPKPGRFYFKMGLYRDSMNEPMTIYIDEYKKSPLSEL